MRNSIGKLLWTVLACLLMLVTLSVPFVPSAAFSLGQQGLTSCERTSDGMRDHAAHTALKDSQSLQQDGRGSADVQCCVGAPCMLMHAGLPVSEPLLLTDPPSAAGLPSNVMLLDGIKPNPNLCPPLSPT